MARPDLATPRPLDFDDAASALDVGFDDAKGVHVHRVRSPYLGAESAVEVLLPDGFSEAETYRVLYVLPVNPGLGGRWGDCLQEISKTDAHNRHDLICVTPSFDTVPWYGAHATDSAIRHESYLLRVLVPYIEARYPTRRRPMDRMLFGFSKSGWGAFLLMLRNPTVFGCAVSWDAPLMMDESHFGTFETEEHYGNSGNFACYLPSRWAHENAGHFRDGERLVLLGHKDFGSSAACAKDEPHTVAFHALLDSLDIAHHYDNTLVAEHSWNQSWMRPAIEALMEVSGAVQGG